MIIGKILGAVFGYFAAGPIGAIVGLLVGHFFDRGLASARGLGTPGHQAAVEQAFFSTAFSVMGLVAKADGRVSEAEIERAEGLMAHFGLSAVHRQEAIALFKRGAAPGFELEAQLADFLRYCAPHGELKNLLLEYLLGVALADGVLHPNEQAVLQRVASLLGFSAPHFAQLLDMVRAQQSFQRDTQSSNPAQVDALSAAYRALGVDPSASDGEVKTAFRRLMSRNHPDKLIAQGVPADMIALATSKTQEIRAAYELIENSRKR